MHKHRQLPALVLALCAVLISASAASAQVTITSPAGSVFPAGPDFATDVLGDPWDFSNPQDIGGDPDYTSGWVADAQTQTHGTSLLLSNGRFIAQSRNNDPGLMLLERGNYDVLNPTRTGLTTPIPSRFRKIAIRIGYSAPVQVPVVYWFHRPDWHPQSANLADMGNRILPGPTVAGMQTLVADLAAAAGQGVPWAGYEGLIRGLRFDPVAEAGVAVELDWVRLTLPDEDPAAAMARGTVGCGASWRLEVLEGGVSTTVASGTGSGGWQFNYGVFPPGNYSLRLVCGGSVSNTLAFAIDAPPHLTITSPSAEGGEDFASSPQFANPAGSGAWDMEHAGDIAKLVNVANVTQTASPNGGNQLSAVNTNGDSAVALMGDANNMLPIPSSRYRHLTFTLTVDGDYDLGQGSVARIIWATSPWYEPASISTSQDMKIYPGRHTYTVDLAMLSASSDALKGTELEFGAPWGSKGVWHLRIDPHEFEVPRGFHLDDVQLRATSEAVIGGAPFPIRWQLADAGLAGPHVVRVYLDDDRNVDPGFVDGSSPRLIASRPNAVLGAPDGIDWAASSGVPVGEYWVFVAATDQATGQTRGVYAPGKLRVTSPASAPVITVSTPAMGGAAHVPFTIAGCASDNGAASIDDLAVYAIGGGSLADPAKRGARVPLGFLSTAPGLGSAQPFSPCASGSGVGFAVTGVTDLDEGPWTLRVLARGVQSGLFGIADVPITVDQRSGPAQNLRLLSPSGSNPVSIAWDPPAHGRAVTAYRLELASSPSFSPLAAQVPVPAAETRASGPLPNGRWFVRVVTESQYTNGGPASNVLELTVGPTLSPVQPPGAPTVVLQRGTLNPVALTWTPGAGGTPTSYTVQAGTRSSASDLGIFPLGLSTRLTANAPPNVTVYVRVVATNAAGSTASNEVTVTVAGGGLARPSMTGSAITARQVTLSWSAVPGASSYTLLARPPGSAAVVATLPGISGTSLTIPDVPPGTYVVSVVALNASGRSEESASVTVTVR